MSRNDESFANQRAVAESGGRGASRLSALAGKAAHMPVEDMASIEPEALYHAATDGELDAITQLLSRSWPESSVLNNALAKACSAGNILVVQHLILHGAAIEPASALSDIPLHQACEAGHVPLVKELLRRGARIDRVNADGETPLSRAAFHGRAAVVELLIKHRASLTASRHGGAYADVTPRERALEGDNPERHTPSRRASGDWALCIRLLADAEAAHPDQLQRSPWHKVRRAISVWPYARAWYKDYALRRAAQEQEAMALATASSTSRSTTSHSTASHSTVAGRGHSLQPFFKSGSTALREGRRDGRDTCAAPHDDHADLIGPSDLERMGSSEPVRRWSQRWSHRWSQRWTPRPEVENAPASEITLPVDRPPSTRARPRTEFEELYTGPPIPALPLTPEYFARQNPNPDLSKKSRDSSLPRVEGSEEQHAFRRDFARGIKMARLHAELERSERSVGGSSSGVE